MATTGEPVKTSELGGLSIFQGMEGFEGVDINDDSSLMALLDDLKEETLISLLDDNLLARDLNDFSWEAKTHHQTEDDLCSHNKLCSDEFLWSRHQVAVGSPDEYLVDAVSLASSRCDEVEDFGVEAKRARLDVREDEEFAGGSKGRREHAVKSVLHDHSYARHTVQRQGSPSNSNSDEEASNEDSSNSDTGYDTMSTSTSPGRGKNKAELSVTDDSSPASQLPLPLQSVVDPVALIDARIKHYMCTREVNLTEEEKETLKAEGLPIPTTLPLTKVEEKALKNVRRKIRNKVAAQESRKRKKEFVQTLEDQVSVYDRENAQLKTRVKTLENENRCLLEEVKKLQSVIAKTSQRSSHTKVGTCIMVIILCFAVYCGGQSPFSLWNNHKHSEYATSSVRSRSLLSTGPATTWYTRASHWIYQWSFVSDYIHDFLGFLDTDYHSHSINKTFSFTNYHAKC